MQLYLNSDIFSYNNKKKSYSSIDVWLKDCSAVVYRPSKIIYNNMRLVILTHFTDIILNERSYYNEVIAIMNGIRAYVFECLLYGSIFTFQIYYFT